MFVHGDGLDVNGSVKVLDFVVVSVEAVVILLGVELNDGGFWVFTEFGWENLNTFQDEEPFDKFLNVFLGHFEIQVVHVALVDVVVLDHLFDLSAAW